MSSTLLVFDRYHFTGILNICIAAMVAVLALMVVPLATKKSNTTGTKFELKLMLFFQIFLLLLC